jgi:hypothetical protein
MAQHEVTIEVSTTPYPDGSNFNPKSTIADGGTTLDFKLPDGITQGIPVYVDPPPGGHIPNPFMVPGQFLIPASATHRSYRLTLQPPSNRPPRDTDPKDGEILVGSGPEPRPRK